MSEIWYSYCICYQTQMLFLLMIFFVKHPNHPLHTTNPHHFYSYTKTPSIFIKVHQCYLIIYSFNLHRWSIEIGSYWMKNQFTKKHQKSIKISIIWRTVVVNPAVSEKNCNQFSFSAILSLTNPRSVSCHFTISQLHPFKLKKFVFKFFLSFFSFFLSFFCGSDTYKRKVTI